MDSSTVVLIIIGVMLVLYITEIIPLAVTSICACLALAIFKAIPLSAAFSGFGNDITYLAIGMMILGNTLFETGVAQILGKKIISVVGTNERVFAVAIILVTTALSLFIANTATVALMLPVTASAVAVSNKKLSKKNTYMMVGMATVTSGVLTMVGSTPQLIAQSILREGGHETMGFFELSYIGLPMLLMLIVYFQTIGFSLQNKVFNFEDSADDTPADAAAEEAEPKSVVKMCIAVGAVVFCIVGFLAELWTMGIVAIVGSVICIVTGCISQKRVFQKMDWATIVILSCSFGIASGLESSGASRFIAQGIISMLGDRITPWLLCAAFTLIGMIFTNFMSSTAMASILIPIAVFAANELGYDVKRVVLVTTIALSIGFATPISTPPMTMTLSGGYRFMDYVKVGGLLNVLCFFLLLAMIPFFV